tara:strand:+ start:1834 stop:2346 length:513 start_codon:yes stop_codon:yes gene_type:complete
MKKLEDLIQIYEDFPKKGILFRDILEILQEPVIFKDLIFKMAQSDIIKNSEAIISIDARGFIFGSAIALQASKPMIVARKPGKLPGSIIKQNYNLEYGENTLAIQKQALEKFNNYAIVDDLLATGGTVDCVAKLINSKRKKIVGLLTVVELISLDGRSKFDFPVESKLTL